MNTEEVRVCRATPYPLPEWALRWKLPDEQICGPTSFNLYDLRGFTFRKETEWVDGWKLFIHIREAGLIKNCLNVQDARALIQTRNFWQPPFIGKRTLCWKSLVCDATRRRNVLVPSIQNVGGRTPVIYWHWLGYKLNLTHCLGLIVPR